MKSESPTLDRTRRCPQVHHKQLNIELAAYLGLNRFDSGDEITMDIPRLYGPR
jgi:hypothetical protein